ncbi:hypothetical protein T552_00035 [Pneumocystis carinii B80]|uniref:3'-5' exonuclease domain-containing protein n=1 Tax=Pneumocystis carinii (strain B80) TaxID=1408658 RepID=A0A0W4ZSQ5_PNEC8|nr:hypothetical protein T552_00035 [Pneumocystis carinii B80]KTW31390.1 hypothetical protein T552_00035 [Pneumocystis carinii B80]
MSVQRLSSTYSNGEKNDSFASNKESKQVPEPKKYRYWSYMDIKNSQGKPQAKIHYILKLSGVQDAISLLKGPYLGFDMEWKPHGDSKIAVIQLSDANSIVLFHLSQMDLEGTFPSPLKDLLENPYFIKCGVGVRNDGYKLYKDFGIIGTGFLELSQLAITVDKDKWDPSLRLIGLTKLAEEYLGKPLFKGSVRYSNWENELIFKQMHYAATDCFAGLKIFERLNDLRQSSDVPLDIPELIDMHLDPSVIDDIQKKEKDNIITA